jgi:hypothetical protein
VLRQLASCEEGRAGKVHAGPPSASALHSCGHILRRCRARRGAAVAAWRRACASATLLALRNRVGCIVTAAPSPDLWRLVSLQRAAKELHCLQLLASGSACHIRHARAHSKHVIDDEATEANCISERAGSVLGLSGTSTPLCCSVATCVARPKPAAGNLTSER